MDGWRGVTRGGQVVAWGVLAAALVGCAAPGAPAPLARWAVEYREVGGGGRVWRGPPQDLAPLAAPELLYFDATSGQTVLVRTRLVRVP